MSTGAREKKSALSSRSPQRKRGAVHAGIATQDTISPAQAHAAEPAIPQRTVCPCGGGCPRCAAKNVASTKKIASTALDSTQGKDSILHRMEGAFGTSFQGVRIRTDAEAADRAQSLRAQAYTDGKEIGFARGVFRPDTQQGLFTIAHEFAHVLQGRGGNGGRMTTGQLPSGSSPLSLRAQQPSSSHADPAEVNADAAAHRVIAGRTPEVAPFTFEGRPRLISTDVAGQLSNPTSVTDPTSAGTSSNPDFINAQILQQQELARSAYAQGQIDQGNQFLSDAEPLKKQAEQAAIQNMQALIGYCTSKVQQLLQQVSEALQQAEQIKGQILQQQQLASEADRQGKMDQASQFRRDAQVLQSKIAQYEKQAEEYLAQIRQTLLDALKQPPKKSQDTKPQPNPQPPVQPQVQPKSKPDYGSVYAQTGVSNQVGPVAGSSKTSYVPLIVAWQAPKDWKLSANTLHLDFLNSLTLGAGFARSDSSTTGKPDKWSDGVQLQLSVYGVQAKLNAAGNWETDIGIQLFLTPKYTTSALTPDPKTKLLPSRFTLDTGGNLVVQQHLGKNLLLVGTLTGGYEDHHDPGETSSKSGLYWGAGAALRGTFDLSSIFSKH